MYYRVEGLKFRGTGSNINLLSSWREKEGGGIEESVRTTKQPFHLADLVEGASTKLKFEAAEDIKPRVYESKRGNYVASTKHSWRAESFREFIIRLIIICEQTKWKLRIVQNHS